MWLENYENHLSILRNIQENPFKKAGLESRPPFGETFDEGLSGFAFLLNDHWSVDPLYAIP